MQLSEAICQFKGWKSLNVKSTTIHGYDQILRQFCVFMRNCEIEKVGERDIVLWFELMTLLGYDRNSFVPRGIALRKLFEYYRHKGLAVLDPWLIPVPEVEYKQIRIITEDEYKRLLAAIPDNNDPRHIRNRAIINLLWDTGGRNGEILSLNLNDLNLEEMTAVVKTEKLKGSHPFRRIIWSKATNKNLKLWLEKRQYLRSVFVFQDPEAVFLSVMGGRPGSPKQGQRFSIKGVGEMLRRYSLKAGMPCANAHSFRHHKGHEMSARGANNSSISSVLGHRSMQSSFRYTQLSGQELIDTGRKYLDKEKKSEPQKILSPMEWQLMQNEIKRLRILSNRVRVR